VVSVVGAYDDLVAEEDGDFETPDGTHIHAGQQALREGPFKPDQLGPCFWCGSPATYGRMDLGGKAAIDACAYHYHNVIAPALAEVEAERERKRKAAALARRGKPQPGRRGYAR
jgi:hypothetical protein